MQEDIKIPKERIAVLIGEKGSTKRKIQTKTKTKINVSSEEGDVQIQGEDSLKVIKTKDIVKAIGRGFNPEVALKLMNEEFVLDLINIHDFSGKSKKAEERLKARVIGTDGKAKRMLEKMTNTEIQVYGKTVAIIGKQEDVYLARRGTEIILNGAPHNNAYHWIQKQLDLQENL
ncbi:KH domain-containing protein [archaeon]|nr:KH domain-containing protein [archaeon]